MMQAASDIFLGWTRGLDVNRHYYWRQLRDMKGAVDVELMVPAGLMVYARTCGWTLARAHARSGDPVAIAEYLSDGDAFDLAITDFSQRHADQNERDFQEFVKAIRSGRLPGARGCLTFDARLPPGPRRPPTTGDRTAGCGSGRIRPELPPEQHHAARRGRGPCSGTSAA